jgi:hypothetical protein
MTARDTYASALVTAATTKAATLTANELTKQETINQSGVNVGYHPGVSTGSSASYEAAVKLAAQVKRDADFAAEQAKQASHMVARDTLRATGDLSPL